jgi:hypothetical protein
MESLNQVLRTCWSIVSKTADEKTRLQALALINDCTKQKVDLSTNGVVVTDAIKYVTQKAEQVNTLQKLDERIETIQRKEEETTTNGVF